MNIKFIRKYTYEEKLVKKRDITELDMDVVKKYASKIDKEKDPLEILYERKFIVKKRGEYYFTNAAILLFTKNPSIRFPSSIIRVVIFEKILDKLQIKKEKLFHKNIYNQIKNVIKFINTERKSNTNNISQYPKDVLEEAIINAVKHSYYLEKNEYINVLIYEDRIEIINPIKNHMKTNDNTIPDKMIENNPVICEVLLSLGIGNRLNLGVAKIFNTMKENKLREPRYIIKEDNKIKLILRYKDSRGFNPLEKHILKLVESGEYSLGDLIEKLNRSRRIVQRSVKKLEDSGYIKWIGTSKYDRKKIYKKLT